MAPLVQTRCILPFFTLHVQGCGEVTMVMKVDMKRDKWNFSKEFGRFRGYYRIIRLFWQNFYWILKLLLKREDTLVTDKNLNPEDWNRHVMILRNSYKRAFDTWSRSYMFDSKRCKGKGYTPDTFSDMMYNELSQKSLRFLIDLISTMCVEDTIYRELFAMWSFEFQFQMNAMFNPNRENVHVLYCNYHRDDIQYLELKKEIDKQAARKNLTGYKMSGKFHQMLDHERQKAYATRRIKVEKDNTERKLRELKGLMTQLGKDKK